MSLWHCKAHGLTGPKPCCDASSRAEAQVAMAPGVYFDPRAAVTVPQLVPPDPIPHALQLIKGAMARMTRRKSREHAKHTMEALERLDWELKRRNAFIKAHVDPIDLSTLERVQWEEFCQ